MTEAEFQAKLDELRALPDETEWVEFKQNDRGDPMYLEVGEYLSALANSCAILRRDRGFIVWGVEDKTHNLIGTDFRPRRAKYSRSQELENWLTYNLDPQVPFWIHEHDLDGKHYVLFEVAAATHVPVAFKGERYVRVGSSKTKLRERPEKERLLWDCLRPAGRQDWSAQVVASATLADLDPAAITFARAQFKNKFPALAAECDPWDDATFLNKAKVCVNGQVTRAALILLGRNESEHYLSPAVARITWVLKDAAGVEKDYQHFGPPFLLAVDQVFARVRNLTYRHLSDATLFPTEVTQYDPWVIREALHNCIAHEDYTQGGKITVVEKDDELLFSSLGDFLPGTVEAVIRRDGPPEFYRNRFLTEAMFNLNMIDTIGSGVRRMFRRQQERHFPMPDYDLTEPGRVRVRIVGKVIDPKYTRLLGARPDLDLWDVIALDKVQKGREVTKAEFKSLKGKKLVEGRRPNLYVSAEVAAATDTKADYIKKRSFDKDHFKKMIVAYLEEFGEANRDDIEKLLWDKLSDALSEDQKDNFIMNLLQELRRNGTIRPVGGKRGKGAKWELSNPTNEKPN